MAEAYGVGGFIGSMLNTNTVTSSAALGASVTAVNLSGTSGTKYAGRIYTDSPASIIANNRAFNGMRVYEDGTADNPTEITGTFTGAHSDQYGLNASDGDFRRTDIWQNPVPPGEPSTWSTEGWPGTFHGMGFDPAVWDFGTVAIRGYPILRGIEGQ